MKTYKISLLLLALVLVVTACSSNKSQSRKYFRLTSTPTVVNSEVKPMTLVVKRPRALSILGGRPIVATQDDDSLVQLSHNFWLDSPKVMMQDRIKLWAENYWQIVSYQTPNDIDYQTLETRILAFEKKQNQAVAELEFFLYDSNYHLIFNHQYVATENIATDDYRAFAKAMSLAIEAIFTQLNSQLNGQP